MEMLSLRYNASSEIMDSVEYVVSAASASLSLRKENNPQREKNTSCVRNRSVEAGLDRISSVLKEITRIHPHR